MDSGIFRVASIPSITLIVRYSRVRLWLEIDVHNFVPVSKIMAKIQVLIKSHDHLRNIFITAQPLIIHLELTKEKALVFNLSEATRRIL